MSAIEYLVDYSLRWADLRDLPEDQVAFLGVLSYAVSEVNALSGIYIFSSHPMIENEAIDNAILIQRFVLLRSWSARLFEAIELLENGVKKRQISDQDLLEFVKECLKELSAIKSSKGYELARDLRNESTNHYSFSTAKKNLKHISDRANCNMYLHEKKVNSFYPFGEEVMFVGRLNRHGASLRTRDKKSNLLDLWISWNLKATQLIGDIQVEFFKKFLLERFPDKFGHERPYWIPRELASTVEDKHVPIFLRT